MSRTGGTGKTGIRHGRALVVVAMLALSALALMVWDVRGRGIPGPQVQLQSEHRKQQAENSGGIWRSTLETLVARDTVDALEQDEQLRVSFGAALEFTGRLSRDLAHRYDLPALRDVGDALADVQNRMALDQARKKNGQRSKRQLLPGLPSPTSPSTGGGTPTNPFASLTSDATNALLQPLKDAFGKITDGLTKNAGGAALFFGIGVGAGAAQGLNVTTGDASQNVAAKVAADNKQEATGLNPAIQNLGTGLSATLVGALSANMSASASGGSGFNLDSLLGNQTLAQVAVMFADGLGSGAVKGLQLATGDKKNAVLQMQAPQGSTAGDTLGAFGFGLTNSLTRNIDTSQSIKIDFSRLGDMFPGVSVGSAAQGFARGLLQGAGDSVNMMGGVTALFNGSANMPNEMPNGTVAFNDTLGGASTGFGQGIGGQGVIIAAQLISKAYPEVLRTNGTTGPVGRRSITDDGVAVLDSRQVPAPAPAPVDPTRPGPNFNLSAIINADTISKAAQSVADVLQCEGIGGVFLILLGLSRSGALPSNTQKLPTLNRNVTDAVRQIVPNGTITFQNRGNKYAIRGQQVLQALDGGNVFDAAGAVDINGNGIVRFIAFLIVHLLVAIVILVGILPLTLGLENMRSILVLRLKKPHAVPYPKLIPRLVGSLWLFVIAPAPILVLIFGSLMAGDAEHFQSAHGILGLLTALFGIPAAGLWFVDAKRPVLRAKILRRMGGSGKDGGPGLGFSFARALFNQLFQTLAVSSVLTGFGDMSGALLCATQILPFEAAVSIGFGLAGLTVVGTLFNWFDFYLAWRISRMAKKRGKKKAEEGAAIEAADMEEAIQAQHHKEEVVVTKEAKLLHG